MRPTHYRFLDGIRGLAALYVVLNHVWARFVTRAEGLPAWFHLLKFGHVAVAIFIVLSGFCLMLPVAQTDKKTLSGGERGFLRRRARRILPAYFAALTLSFGLAALVPRLRNPGELSVENALLHLFLVHNWVPRFSISLNGPLWSVALEWQIYFVFAFLLLPLRRRWGILAALGAALLVSTLLVGVGLGPGNPWLLVLFAVGMLGAELVQRPVGRGFTALTLALTALSALVHLVVWRDHFPWPDSLWLIYGLKLALDLLLSASVLCWLVAGVQGHAPLAPVFRVLSSRPLVALGTFSYSIYLMHDPLLALSLPLLDPLIKAAPLPTFAFAASAFVPATLGLCYLFYRVCERPFLKNRVIP